MICLINQALAARVGLGCYFEQSPKVEWRLALALQGTVPHFAYYSIAKPPWWTNEAAPLVKSVMHLECCFLFIYVTFYGSCVMSSVSFTAPNFSPKRLRAQGVAAGIMDTFAMTLGRIPLRFLDQLREFEC